MNCKYESKTSVSNSGITYTLGQHQGRLSRSLFSNIRPRGPRLVSSTSIRLSGRLWFCPSHYPSYRDLGPVHSSESFPRRPSPSSDTFWRSSLTRTIKNSLRSSHTDSTHPDPLDLI